MGTPECGRGKSGFLLPTSEILKAPTLFKDCYYINYVSEDFDQGLSWRKVRE